MACLLTCWNVPTHIDVGKLQPLAVRVWAHEVQRLTKMSPEKLAITFMLSTKNNKPMQTFYRYRNSGRPTPPLFDKLGRPACALLIEREYAGTLRNVVHPIFVLLSAPVEVVGISALRAMLGVSSLPSGGESQLFQSGGDGVLEGARKGVYVGLDAAACQVAYLVHRLARGKATQKMVDFTVEAVTLMLDGFPKTISDDFISAIIQLPGVYAAAGMRSAQATSHRLFDLAAKGRTLAEAVSEEELLDVLTQPIQNPTACELDPLLYFVYL